MSELFEKEDQPGDEALEPAEQSSVERYLVFESGELRLFISTNYVIEIINDHPITPVPMIPPYIKGIINLRGQILPVVNIRLCMDHEETEYTTKTCIIVLQIDSVPLGIIVDAVQQVIDIDPTKIHSIPVKRQQKLLDGMVTLEDGRVFMSFDCHALLSYQY